ncbi:sulfatase family protein [Marinoscillum furvescens]|uniref:Arylsulfatase A-like enzyme n=1 Tax=Marinoscillum furvescens DSM 4134 TaxID=1122208 RepID=A0A3D9L2Y2_MARFU|nr:sulfatase-like hydrolase/transferase [Marinoscillum furvescens]RED98344.1 arylsulfatase A-like enzyme [Marinoscillum furvescens DSM 4134]
MNKQSYFLLIMVILTACQIKDSQSIVETKKPNIIFLMDDQHRWDALGIINQQIKTPTLDSLARSGIHFDQAVCQAPMCVPSRNSIMLGLYPNQTGVLRNPDGLKDEELPTKTLAEYLRDAGYETAGFGKTHWGKHKTSTRGFETRYVSEIPEEGAKSMAELDSAAKARYDAEIASMGPGEENNIGYLGFTSKVPEEDHRDGWISKKCLEYIEERDDDRPLFLYLSFMKPHAGHNVPKGYEDLYEVDSIDYAQQPPWDKDYSPHAAGVNRRDMYVDYWKDATEQEWKLMTMRYYANVTWMDDMMGRAIRALKTRGLLENSIIIYTSDHGEMLGERYYRFNKYCLYDGSVRVPLILSGTVIPKNVTDSRPVDLVDVLPTLLQSAGVSYSDQHPGYNLLAPNQREGAFTALHERPDEASFMWRTKRYKLILIMNRKENNADYSESDIKGGELYDLQDDPNEWKDLYNKESASQIRSEYTSNIIEKLNALSN